LLQPLTNSRLANLGAHLIVDAFDRYRNEFRAITHRARSHFEHRDWHALRRDAGFRLDLYGHILSETIGAIRHLLSARIQDRYVWAGVKAVYSGLIGERDDWELAETFLISVPRRIFVTVGVDPQIEFVDTDFDASPGAPRESLLRSYPAADALESLIYGILSDYAFALPYEDRLRDARDAARAIGRCLDELGLSQKNLRAQMLREVFYRGQRAYVIGRLWCADTALPLVLALENCSGGIVVDAVLCSEDDVSILFSFARSYFQVDVQNPRDSVAFLHQLMPRKPIAELYIALGHHRHGKTELYRHLLHHLATCDEQFVVAPGARGMVMVVFTLPSYDLVFKVIRDVFDEPKRASRADVLRNYSLVFKHDRAGRLIDAQEFEHLEFDLARFSASLIQDLQRLAGNSVRIDGNRVSIRHLYVEHRVEPLDLFIKHVDENAVAAAVLDYGCAIKDLACANIFPGDLLLKNFGVTRQGRVVFYDYDELCLLTECKFRRKPEPRDSVEEMSDEPWFYIGENDCFPSEFKTWLGLEGPWRSLYLEHHGDLFEIDFWVSIQNRIRNGEVIDIRPYASGRRLIHER
jgi:isocitrate dehydrogenase kinase/phosphatase